MPAGSLGLWASVAAIVLMLACAGLFAASARRSSRAARALEQERARLAEKALTRERDLEQENRTLREDLAVRSRAAKVLEQSEERFRWMLDGIVDYVIILLDPLGNIASWNAGAERIVGYRAEEIIGQHVSLLHPREPAARERLRASLEKAALEGRSEAEGARVRKDGSSFWASEIVTRIHDGSGRMAGFSHVLSDLSQRRRAESLLQESEERFRRMVESVVDYAIYMLDPEGRVTSWNVGASRIYGYHADEIKGQHFSRFYPREQVEKRKPGRELEVAAVSGRYESEGWRMRKDGSTFWANVIITTVRDASGGLVGFSKVTRDLTERRRVELELLAAKAAAERASKAKTEFLATMSHELRTPLNSLLILSRLLADNAGGHLTAKQVEYAKTIHASGMDLLSLISDILDLARIESGAPTPLYFRMEPLSRLTGDLERSFRQVAESKGLAFDVRVDPGLPAAIRTDAQRLQQIVKNLLSNAFKFTKAGRVSLELAPARAGWTHGHEKLSAARQVIAISVADTGIGIPADKQELIFEAFQQADGGTSREYGGTGLGLSISRALARLLGGELRLRSVVREGSTFTLYLPMSSDLPAEETKVAQVRLASADS